MLDERVFLYVLSHVLYTVVEMHRSVWVGVGDWSVWRLLEKSDSPSSTSDQVHVATIEIIEASPASPEACWLKMEQSCDAVGSLHGRTGLDQDAAYQLMSPSPS